MKYPFFGINIYWRFKGEKAYRYGYPVRDKNGLVRMGRMKNLAMWLINNVPLGRLAPYVLGYAIGAKKWKRTDNQAN